VNASASSAYRWAPLWVVPGAAHVDLHAYAPAEYEQQVGAFMARNLGR
jgi:hypothetical protein